MFKVILISIKPKWVAKILNGEKTIEVRKKFPKDYKGWVYIYCTKEDSLIKLQERYKDRYTCEQEFRCDDFPKMYSGYEGKGKVVARFYCDKVDKWDIWQDDLEEKLKLACLSVLEFDKYSKGQVAYAIHISQLEIFDKPKELREFKTTKERLGGCWQCENYGICVSGCNKLKPLTKAPQSYMFIEVEE